MFNQQHLSKVIGVLGFIFLFGASAHAEQAGTLKKNETSFYRDLYDQGVHGELTQYLHLDRLYQKIAGKKIPAANVNRFDEVPDSSYFTNRHNRRKLSLQQLEEGYRENTGPDLTKGLTVKKVSSEGRHLLFEVLDGKGDRYFLKFDTAETPELMTSSDVVTSRFYYAIGFNVPQCDLIHFTRNQLTIASDATVIGESGFESNLTPERLDEALLFLSMDAQSRYRATAHKSLAGEDKGWFGFSGNRKEDQADSIPHEDRRELRALNVFASWMNDIELRTGTTESRFIDSGGKKVLRHYLLGYVASMGSGDGGVKAPEFGYEYLLDYGTVLKSVLSFGFWEKPWEKRWREAGEQVTQSPAVGYFDNHYFNPGAFKTALPNLAFKKMTRADGFWAAKMIMNFSDEEVAAMVKAGRYSSSEDARTITKILTGRRDLIGQYWFKASNPLDELDFANGILTFKDLGVTHGFWKSSETLYQIEILGEGCEVLNTLDSKEPSFDLKKYQSSQGDLKIKIRTLRVSESLTSPFILVKIKGSAIHSLSHEE